MSALITAPPHIYVPLNKTIGVVECVLIVVVAVFHFHSTHKHNLTGLKYNKSQPDLFLSAILIFSSIYYLITLCIDIFEDSFDSYWYCNVYGKYFGVPSYIALKLIIYLILVCRLYTVFESSNYGYSYKKLKIWCIILVSWSVLNIFLIAFTTKTIHDYTQVPVCATILFPPSAASMTFLDMTAGIINTYLFVKPLMKLHKATKMANAIASGDGGETSKLMFIAKKQAYLTIIAVASTIIALTGVVLFLMPQLFAGLDILVSTLAIILMYKWNGFLTDKLFYCCLKNDKMQELSNMMSVTADSTADRNLSSNTNSKNADQSNDNTVTDKTDIEITVTKSNTNTDQVR